MPESVDTERKPQDARLADHPYGKARKVAEKSMSGRMIQGSWVETDRSLRVALLLSVILCSAYAEIGLFGQLVNTVQSNSIFVYEGLIGHGWGKW